METLEIKKENALKAYNNGCPDVKKVLENLFGKESFTPKNVIDRVKTFDDACTVLGMRKPEIVINETKGLDDDLTSMAAYARLIIITRALNEGWVPDWKNTSQYKYYPWFDMSSGSGLSYCVYGDLYSYSSVGSRLFFKSRELAEYAGKQFIKEYTDFFIIK